MLDCILQQWARMQVNVFNDLPSSYPQTSTGVSIHWHGLSQKGFEWQDGTGYASQCPIVPGQNFTYLFQVMQLHVLSIC